MTLNETDVLKVDTEMQGGARSVNIYYWEPSAPGLIGVILTVINPGYYSDISSALDSTFSSLRFSAVD